MKRVLITGANRGIGLALVDQYLSADYHVYAVCREPSVKLEKSGAEVIEGVDLRHEQSYQNIFQALGNHQLDVLINNAGILHQESLDNMNFDTVLQQFQVNALAPLKVSYVLQDYLTDGSKLAMITSRMGSMADNGSGGYYGYRMSKAALNAAAVSLAKDLAPKGIAVAVLHPGFVQTDMVGGAGDVDAETSASLLKQRIDQLQLSESGKFWHANGQTLPW